MNSSSRRRLVAGGLSILLGLSTRAIAKSW
jgi:hypothetical protein